MASQDPSPAPSMRIPEQGLSQRKLLDQMRGFRAEDADWAGARTWSMVYYAGKGHHDFLKRAHNLYFATNGLNPMAFKSLKRMETEVARMTATMLHGDAQSVGTMTSGGTESILLAVKAARDRARKRKPWILSPEIVVPKTIHVAFDKACHYFGVKARYIEVDADCRVNVAALKRAVGRNTILIAASAPQYPHGVVDPIEAIGAFAAKKKIPFHVDACIGGFILPWIEKLGYPVPLWDFRVPGVTSISADVHKYGYAAKGASTITYRDMSYLKYQFFVSTNWPGGIYASPSMPGTRPGGGIAAAWAAMRSMGEDGYMQLAKTAMETAATLKSGLNGIDGLEVIGDPHATIVTYRSTESAIDIYVVADLLEGKGWSVDRQQFPNSIHCTVNANNAETVDEYLSDVAEAVSTARAHPELASEGNAAMYGMMAKVPFRGMVKLSVQKVMESMYGPDGEVPDLSKLGEGEDDGLILKLMSKYGDQAMDALDTIQAQWSKMRGLIGRGGG